MKATNAASAKKGNRRGSLDLRAVFSEFDRDGSGTIDKEELGGVLDRLGVKIDDRELDTVFRYFDKDGAGCEYAEFQYAYFNKKTVTKTKGARNICQTMRQPLFAGNIRRGQEAISRVSMGQAV